MITTGTITKSDVYFTLVLSYLNVWIIVPDDELIRLKNTIAPTISDKDCPLELSDADTIQCYISDSEMEAIRRIQLNAAESPGRGFISLCFTVCRETDLPKTLNKLTSKASI
ncbi:hypothetical protein I8H84_01090 [Candidatus Saccharibacteria bacterium]|nr:hypothetical protein [Candidatus Saccharibacteria bacterium]MBH1972542.1 hypothetical protein [Candidatus Saccharibacteria bacterium]MBH1990744.1 hypothetical protein [Candidatus Saccharibacteria bacterium]